MTNITLSIDEKVYRKMRKHSEVKWSEFVRKAIERRVEELDSLERHPASETILTMLASERVLRDEWENPEDERWNDA